MATTSRRRGPRAIQVADGSPPEVIAAREAAQRAAEPRYPDPELSDEELAETQEYEGNWIRLVNEYRVDEQIRHQLDAQKMMAADRGAQRARALAAGNADARRWAKSSPTLADLAAAIEALPQALLRPQDGGAMLTTRIDARRLHLALLDEPSVVYIDPPYAGTSCGYAAELSRANVLTIAHRFISRGYPVVVSEAEPLPALDCAIEHRQLAGPTGGGRTASKQQAEWLTIYRPTRSSDGH